MTNDFIRRFQEQRHEELLDENERRYPGFRAITRRAAELETVTPQFVPGPDGKGRVLSSDPRWQMLMTDARAVIGD